MPSADLSARGYSDRNYGTCAPRKRDACLRSARLSRCAGSSIVLLFVALILRGAGSGTLVAHSAQSKRTRSSPLVAACDSPSSAAVAPRGGQQSPCKRRGRCARALQRSLDTRSPDRSRRSASILGEVRTAPWLSLASCRVLVASMRQGREAAGVIASSSLSTEGPLTHLACLGASAMCGGVSRAIGAVVQPSSLTFASLQAP